MKVGGYPTRDYARFSQDKMSSSWTRISRSYFKYSMVQRTESLIQSTFSSKNDFGLLIFVIKSFLKLILPNSSDLLR